MKNKFIFNILAGAALVGAISSCDLNKTPVFDDADAFVAIDKTSVTVNETVGTITIPVTIASVNPVKTAVTYEVVDGSAKAGTDYVLVDDSAVLSFDGKERTMSIEIQILPHVGTYTGDLDFTINLLSGGKKLNLGAESSCKVRISDLDHPLADILGEYSCTATDKALGSVSWTMRMSKDPEDTKVVWVDYICPFAASNPSMEFSVYGNVSEDHNTIVFPCGQKPGAEYGEDDPFVFIWFNYADKYIVDDAGTVTMTKGADGRWTTEDGMGFSSAKYVFSGAMILKGTAVWTKID